jgi:methionine--tRNA ligase beta chain
MKEEITYDDFKKLDIRIGEVVSAERVLETDKLLRCEVNFGDDVGTRIIVSGIAEYVSPEDIVGKKFPYLVNLAPRTIREVESQGMILAIGGNIFSLIAPENSDVPPGSSVS